MESDEFDFLAPAYVRGFLKTYARFLRLNAEPLLEDFDRRFGSGRFETQQIVALERHGKKHTPKEPRFSRSWSVAAFIAAGALLILGVVGLVTGPEEPEGRRDTALVEPSETPTPTEGTIDIAASPSVTGTPEEERVAFTEGIEVEVIVVDSDCWVDITSDGTKTFSETLTPGDTETFTAEEEMNIVLGYPAGVELVINGENVGTPGGSDPLTFTLPDDFETFL
jgi:cytoskeletal protein RodZ